MSIQKSPIVRIFLRFLGLALGALALVAGEFDDSPGLQGIGMILILSVFFSIFKIVRRHR
jgi:hypothetical protein